MKHWAHNNQFVKRWFRDSMDCTTWAMYHDMYIILVFENRDTKPGLTNGCPELSG